MRQGFYDEKELASLGLGRFGDNVLISRKCSIYSAAQIFIGSNVRVDDFCILSGKIEMGSYVHISAGVKIYASEGCVMGNFCGISANSTIYTAVDDFSGDHMISPMVPDHLRFVKKGSVVLEDFVQLAPYTQVMPGVVLQEGAVTGAFSFVNKSLGPWSINFGVPCRYKKERSSKCKNLSRDISQ